MAVTIKDVAAAAGVSPSTVSRTCKDSPSISRETKERVRRIMAQLGYEPNFEAVPFLFLREAERPHFSYFLRYSRGVMPKCALNARLK